MFRRKEVTIRMLLAHSSGLPAYEKLFLHAVTRDELVCRHDAGAPCGRSRYGDRIYSDLGFILLGELLSKVADESLDRFSDREIFDPLGMAGARFVHRLKWATQIPPTEDDINFRHRIIQGEVNDENSSVMGGISGHAGVFGSALDVATFAHCVLNGGSPIVKAETIAMFTRREHLLRKLRARSGGTLLRHHHNRGNFLVRDPMAIWASQELHCGAIPTANCRLHF
jgi:CubicO group peptidase (beta-lactamase class C family)